MSRYLYCWKPLTGKIYHKGWWSGNTALRPQTTECGKDILPGEWVVRNRLPVSRTLCTMCSKKIGKTIKVSRKRKRGSN